MSDKGGLPAIHPYEIARHWYLHELRRVRAEARVRGPASTGNILARKKLQRLLCSARKEYYK